MNKETKDKCKMTTSNKHMPVEVVIYDVGERLNNSNVKAKNSYIYWKCMACNLIFDDRKPI